MAVHLSEEEQLENLKRWWAENGKSTVIMVVLAIAAYIGWGQWQDRQQAAAEAASGLYQGLRDALVSGEDGQLDDEQRANVNYLGGQLKDQYGSNLYASQAALYLARVAVEDGDLERAAAELEWVIKRDVDPAVTLLAKGRLARVLLAQGQAEAALSLVAEPGNSGFDAAFAELRGDILLQQGKLKEARAAYRFALDNLSPEQENRRQLLQIKLDDLREQPLAVGAGTVGTEPQAGEKS